MAPTSQSVTTAPATNATEQNSAEPMEPMLFLTNNGTFNSIGTPLTESFDTLATSGTTNTWTDNTTPIVGFYSTETTYRADAGTGTTGALYSYGTGTNTDRALGALTSGTTATVRFGAKFTNNTGTPVTSLAVAFTGEQWRQNAAAQTLVFEYQVGATSLTTGTWVPVTALDFVSPNIGTAGALDGNAAANRTAKSSTITVTVAAGQTVWFRWTKTASSSHGLAIDDLSVTPNGATATNYYLKASGNADLLSSWTDDVTLAAGSAPANFTAASQVFNVRNQATPTIGASWTVSGSGSKIVVGDGTNACNFTIPSGNTVTGTVDVSAAATLTTQTTTAPTFGTLNATSTVVYDGAGAQAITATNYGNLTLSNSGSRTLSGTVGISGTFTPGSATISTGTFDFNGAGAQTIPAFNYANLTSSSSGARTLASSGTIGIAGTFTPGTNAYTVTGSTIDFNSTGSQTINAFNYNNLTISGSRGVGTVTLASGIIDIAGTFNPTATFSSGAYAVTGNTVRFSSAGSQTVPAFNYATLTNSNNGARVLSPTGTIGIATALTANGSAYTVTDSTVNYNGTAGATITGANSYHHLTISGTGTYTFSANNTIAGNYSQTGAATVVANASTSRTLTIGGNFNISNGTFILGNVSGATSTAVNVTGNVNLSATGKVNLEAVSSTSGAATLNVTGNFVSTGTSVASGGGGGVVDFGTGTVTGNAINITGNFDKSGIGTFGTTSTSPATGFAFVGTGSHTFSYAGASSDYTQYVVNSSNTLVMSTGLTLGSSTSPISTFTVNGTLDMGTQVLSSGDTNGTFTLGSTGHLRTGNASGINGSITVTGTKTFPTTASYTYNGAVNQVTGTFLPATVANLTIANTGTSPNNVVTLSQAVAVTGTATIAPTVPSVLSLASLSNTAGNLNLGGLGRINGSWGSTSSAATTKSDTYFLAGTTGTINVTNDTRTASVINTAPTASAISFGQTLASSVLSGGTATPSGGTFAFTTPATAPAAGTAAQSVTYTPTDTTAYTSPTTNVNVTVNQATQTINFTSTAPSGATVGGATYAATATGGASGNGVAIASITTSVCTGSGSSGSATITFVGAGTCTIRASQAGNTNYSAASDVDQSFTVIAGTYTLTYQAGSNGSVTGTLTQNVASGADGTAVTAVPDAGYRFDKWTPGDSTANPRTDTNVTASATYTANFVFNDVTYGTGAANLPAGSYHDITVGSGAVITLTGNIVITGTITVQNGGTLDMGGYIITGGGAFTLDAGGSLSIGTANGGIWKTAAQGSIQLSGTRTYSTAGFYRLYGDVDSAVGDGLPTTVAGLTIANGAHTVTGNNVASPGQVVTGTLRIISGNYVGHSDYTDVIIENLATLTLTDATTVSGNWTNNGGTLAGNFGVTFDGAGDQAIHGSTTFYDLAFAAGARTITFDAGSTQSATNSFAAAGTAGNLISLRSSSTGNAWTLNVPTSNVSYLDVKDSNSTNTTTATHSVDSGGNNANWIFNYTLTYSGNGNTGGTAPASVTQASSSTTTVSGVGSLVKDSDHFVRWNTAANGSGTNYNAASTFTFTGDTTLYAQWLAACPVGKYFNGTGCVDASPGYYVGAIGQTTQTPCAAGTYQQASGSSSCNDADAGYYVATEGSETQTKCEVGKYQDLTGQSSCKDATPGHYVSTTGATSQTNTPAGTFIPGSNATAAGAMCIAGTYQNLAGQASCKPADANYYVPAAGATEQLPCPVGTSSTGGATQCTLNNYTVTYNGNNETSGTAPTSPGSGDYNTTIVLPGAGDLLKTGYSFGGWNTLANGTGTNYAAGANYTIPASNSILYAKWVATTFTLTATPGANGNFKLVNSGNPNDNGVTTVNPGESRTYRIVPDPGYQVANVLVDSVSVGKGQSYTFTNVQANHTIEATFEAVTNRTLTAGTVNTYYDAVIDVPVTIDDTTGANIIGVDYRLNYDSTKLAPVFSSGVNVQFTNGSLGLPSGSVTSSTAGIITVARNGTAPLAGSGTLLTVKMRVLAHATTTAALTITVNPVVGDYFNGGAVPANAPVAGVVNINPTATSTSVVTSGTPSTYGNSVTFTATVATAGTPAVSGGSVTFYDGGTCASPGPTLGSQSINGSGVAAISTAALAAGNHTIVACYGGTVDFTASGGSVAQVVDLRAVTVTATDATKGYDGTTSSSAVPTLTAGTTAAGETATYSQTYDNRNVGINKVLTPAAVIRNGSNVDVSANYAITLTNGTGVITARAITITAVTSTKVYDGTTTSSGTPTLTSGTIAAGETAVYSQTFDTKNVGTSKTLTPSAVITDGSSVDVTANYAVTPVTDTTGEITARPITITAGTDSKTYDGTTSSAGTTTLTSGTLASGDTAVYSQTFDTRNVGTGKTLTPSAVISDGASVNVTANYAITPITDTTGEITARAITITAVTSTKAYDGTTASSGTPTLTSGTLASGDTAVYSQVYDSRNVGSRTLTPSAVISDGASVNVTANYAITPVTASGSITARAITITAATDSKAYDGTTASSATPTLTGGTLASGDTAVYSQVFDSRDVGSRTLTPSAVITDGASVNVTANYAITPVTASGSITARAITITAGTDSKVYDGTTSSAGTTTLTAGTLASGETAVYSQTFDTKNIGTGKTLTPAVVIRDSSNVVVTANYAVTPVVNTTGEITARAITVTAGVDSKVYDGTTASSVTPTLTSGTIAAGETATYSQVFDTKHVGTNKVLTPSAVIRDAGLVDVTSNYVVTPITNTAGEITARAITVTATTSTKGYDGTTTSAATPTLTAGTIAAGETAVYSQTFDNRNVGTNKVLTPSAIITDSGSNNVNSNYAITLATVSTGEITARAITITAGTDTKVYDGTTSSGGTTSLTSGTLAAGETAVYSQTFDTKNVGTNKVLTPSVIIKDGSNVVVTGNYAVTPVTNNTGEITARPITVTAVTDTREYNGTTSSAGTPSLTGTLAAGDSAVYSQVFANKNVGTSKTIIPSAVITDSGSNNVNANYAINLVNNTTGEITARAITITAVTSTKVYDGTTSSTGIPVLGPGTIAAGETAVYSQTFDSRTVGTGKTLTPTVVITDSGSTNVTANYAVTTVTNTTGEITARPITITAASDSKQYDRTTSSAGVTTLTSGTLAPSETAVYSQTFDTKDVGTNKTLTPSVVIRDASNVVVTTNYAVTPIVNTSGVITAKNLTAAITAADKTYDGNDNATITSCTLTGVILPDSVTCSATNAHFNDASVGANKPVSADINLDVSADSGNYTVTSPAFTTASITSGTVTGTINYYAGTNDAVSGVTVSGAGGILVSGITNASGIYSITGFGAGSYTMTPTRAMQLCDTQNGVLIDDAALVSEYVVGLTPLTTTQRLAAKVSGTATANLSSFDAALIAQKSVGICDSPNIAGRWGFAPGTYTHNPVSVHTDNYTAYLMGDVNGDWSSSAVPNIANRESSSPNAVRASLPVGNAQPGTEVTVPFRIDNLNGKSLNSYQFSVAYDPAVIVPADESANVDGTLSGNLNAVYNTPTPGMLRVGVYGAFPTQGDGVYVNLKFRVIGNNGSSSPLTINGFRFNHGTDEVTSVHGRITVGVATAEATLQGRVLAMGGRGVTAARVHVTSSTGEVRSAFTTRYGQFIISGLTIGETYTVSVQSRRFVFAPRSVPISDSVTSVEFVAEQ